MDVSPEAMVAKIETILHELGSLERLLAYTSADMNTSLICQDIVVLRGSICSKLQGNHSDTDPEIRSVVEQLRSIIED